MSFNEECCKNPERKERAGGEEQGRGGGGGGGGTGEGRGPDWTVYEQIYRTGKDGEIEECCLHRNTQVLSQSQTRKNLFGRMVSLLFQAEKLRGRV